MAPSGHLGTDINYVVLENLYNELKEQVDFFFLTPVTSIEYNDSMYTCTTARMRLPPVNSVSSPSDEAAANGWKLSPEDLQIIVQPCRLP